MRLRERNKSISGTRFLRTVGICPAEIVDQRATLLDTGTILCIILMDVEPKKRRIDWCGRIKHLHTWDQSFRDSQSHHRETTDINIYSTRSPLLRG